MPGLVPFARRTTFRSEELDKRVDFKSGATSSDWGASDPDWENPTTVAASVPVDIWFVRGQEAADAKQIRSNVAWRIKLRYRSDLTTEMRAYWGSKVLEIEVIDTAQQRDGVMLLHCAEIGA